MIFVRGLISENRVPALFNEKDSWGTVTLIDSHLHGIQAERGAPAIHNQRQIYLRNVDLLGYDRAVDQDDKGRDKGDIGPAGTVAEDTSHQERPLPLPPDRRRHLRHRRRGDPPPAKETPVVPWGNPAKDWANLLDFGADPTGAADASAALQKAIDSGAPNLYLPAGVNFRFGAPSRSAGPCSASSGLRDASPPRARPSGASSTANIPRSCPMPPSSSSSA